MITVRALLSNISKGQSAVSAKKIIEGLEKVYESIRNRMLMIKNYEDKLKGQKQHKRKR